MCVCMNLSFLTLMLFRLRWQLTILDVLPCASDAKKYELLAPFVPLPTFLSPIADGVISLRAFNFLSSVLIACSLNYTFAHGNGFYQFHN